MEKQINTESDQRACAYTDDKSTNNRLWMQLALYPKQYFRVLYDKAIKGKVLFFFYYHSLFKENVMSEVDKACL